MTTQPITPNRLSTEKSPYLLQHASNPVDWYPWGAEAFAKAAKEDKPIFLSIGYSTCHWCHVMEKESFENAEVADLLNKYYVAIKVDREERPDIDQLYMNAVVTINGSGGWPMSVFLTADLKPFFGASYFSRKDFVTVLARVQMLWETKRADLVKSADQMLEHLKTLDPARAQNSQIPISKSEKDSNNQITNPKTYIFKTAFENLSASFEKLTGGFHPAPKFPPSRALMFLMRLHAGGVNNALEMAGTTLDRMAEGGIYDQLGGGFHRYSTDECWLVPHFEKMLYDNANLSAAYTEAFQLTRRPEYGMIARETLDYVLREMTGANGGFYTAQDADTGAGEGAYFVWTKSEIETILGKPCAAEFCGVYGVTDEGNFDDTNILTFKDVKQWVKRYEPGLLASRTKLLEARGKRPRPLTDDKIIVESNGLMINSLAMAYQAFGEEKYLEAALAAALFINERLYKDHRLKRYYRAGAAPGEALLDDYAFLIQGLITLYESTFEEGWLTWALELQKTQDELFRDGVNGSYFNSAEKRSDIIARGRDFYDSSNPNGNAVSALNLLRLYHLTYREEFEAGAKQIFAACSALADRGPENMAQMLIALDYYYSAVEAAVVTAAGKTLPDALVDVFYRGFLPNKAIALCGSGQPSGVELVNGKKLNGPEFTIYICAKGSCKNPTGDPTEIRKQLSALKRTDPLTITI